MYACHRFSLFSLLPPLDHLDLQFLEGLGFLLLGKGRRRNRGLEVGSVFDGWIVGSERFGFRLDRLALVTRCRVLRLRERFVAEAEHLFERAALRATDSRRGRRSRWR